MARPQSLALPARRAGNREGQRPELRASHGQQKLLKPVGVDDASGRGYDDIDPLMWDAAKSVTHWPSGGLFPAYF
jgi:hypothetical protein